LVTEISSWEFLFGKIFGVFYVAKEMLLTPLVLCLYLRFVRALTLETFVFITAAWLVMTLFVSMLGIHCGTISIANLVPPFR
jgi:ABC-type Na+ efflux pump permease subunit